MYSTNVVVSNEFGLHARPAARIAKRAEHARSDIWLISGNETADAKSVISILMLACRKGSVITVKAEDRTDVDVLNNIAWLIENNTD